MNTNTTASYKVRNPLLTAAGFPLENYTENALLVPVTPATPAVLQDDTELDNFVGQEPVDIAQSQVPLASKTHEPLPTNASSQSKENKDTANQPAKQGYFTSILSSLPNLSLSSIKTDLSGTQINQTSENTGGVVQESNPYTPLQGRHGSQPDISGSLAINPQDSRSTDPSGFAAFGSPSTLPSPPQPTVPPSSSLAGDAPVSYRLGNQRRLKYAPPPDLTSNNAKPYENPAVQTFFAVQNISSPPKILNPYESEGSSNNNKTGGQPIGFLSEQSSVSEQLSRNSSLQSSFRSSPVTTGPPYSSSTTSGNQTPRFCETSVSAPLQITSSSAKPIPSQLLEPATPQNTPANIQFPGFVPQLLNRDLQPSNLEREVASLKSANQLNSPPEFPKDSTSETTVQHARKAPLTSAESDGTFTLISAAKVTEKLEHLLAEQAGSSPHEAFPEASSEVDEVVSGASKELTKSFELQRETLQASANEPIDRSYETKLDDTQGKAAYLTSDTLSDVFLGQKPASLSATSSEVYTFDNNLVADTWKTLSVHPPQQYPQAPLTSTSYPVHYREDKLQNKKPSNLDYAPPVQHSQPNNFYNPLETTKASASIYFDSTAKSRNYFSNSSFQENSANAPFSQSVDDTTNKSQQTQEIPTFNSATIDSTVYPPFWSADQTTPSQTLNSASNQLPSSIFYNPADFINKSPQSTFPYMTDQHSAQKQLYENLPFSQNNDKFPQLSKLTVGDSNVSSFSGVTTTIPELTGSATLSPTQMSINSPNNRTTADTIPPSLQNLASGPSDHQRMSYREVYHHWFYRREVETKTLWDPFSMQDSLKLEEVHNSSDITPETTVATDGGRYDVDILRRQRAPVYWTGKANEVRRCSWFYSGPSESKYVPYDETTAAKLEEEYKQACLTNNWNRRIDLNNGEYILFHSATVQVHYLPQNSSDSGSWGSGSGSEDSTYLQGASSRPRNVKRGVGEFNIDEGEPEKVDHLLFLVHGIGSVCDLKFRTVEEVVDEFRSISLQLVQSHYRTASTQGIVNRIEVLPISWHATLHSSDTGIDKKLQAITLESIPKLRHFTNDTLLDILFYTSPIYCQTIMQTVGNEMNKLFALFKERNPIFEGEIYIGGHSLGSLILFDLLCHQKPKEMENNEDSDDNSDKGSESDSIKPIKRMPAPVLKRRLSKRISYVMGAAGTGQPFIHYPQLSFHPRAFFALGSPIGMFVTVRGIDTLGDDFTLPTCPAFFNIFHPFDPVAYRMESLINPEASKYRPMLIPHHKGRKRMHLELKETMARVGADLKQRLYDSVKSTWNSFYQLALFHKSDNQALANEIDKVVEEQLQQTQNEIDQSNNDDSGVNIKIGKLNGGRRIDYVLQEAPFEYINEYIFALTSHICYWESEDTMLLILKEIYGSMGIQTDAQLPQQTMSIERMSPSPSILSSLSPSKSNAETPPSMGVDPTVPISNKPVGPPPKAGFVRKS